MHARVQPVHLGQEEPPGRAAARVAASPCAQASPPRGQMK
jgi:hypothetical protein